MRVLNCSQNDDHSSTFPSNVGTFNFGSLAPWKGSKDTSQPVSLPAAHFKWSIFLRELPNQRAQSTGCRCPQGPVNSAHHHSQRQDCSYTRLSSSHEKSAMLDHHGHLQEEEALIFSTCHPSHNCPFLSFSDDVSSSGATFFINNAPTLRWMPVSFSSNSSLLLFPFMAHFITSSIISTMFMWTSLNSRSLSFGFTFTRTICSSAFSAVSNVSELFSHTS